MAYYEFLGALRDFNTSIYEGSIKELKRIAKQHGNNKAQQVCRTILTRVRTTTLSCVSKVLQVQEHEAMQELCHAPNGTIE